MKIPSPSRFPLHRVGLVALWILGAGPLLALEEVFVPIRVEYPGFRGFQVGVSGVSVLGSSATDGAEPVELPSDVDFGLGLYGRYEMYLQGPWSVALQGAFTKNLITWHEDSLNDSTPGSEGENNKKISLGSLKNSWILDVCARGGYVIKSMRPYVEGGPSMASIKVNKAPQAVLWGLRLGGGVGFSFSPNFITEIGYTYHRHWRAKTGNKAAWDVSRHGVVISLGYKF